jgi:hypothetical protein
MRESDRRLSKALELAGLPQLAGRAGAGEWNDFFGEHDLPQHHLIYTLDKAAERTTDRRTSRAIVLLKQAVMDGVFDGTKEESDEWGRSPEGQQAIADANGRDQAVVDFLKRFWT